MSDIQPQRLFLLSCCAPCAAAALEFLRAQAIDTHVFYYNPNIIPEAEYEKRAAEMRRLSAHFAFSYVQGPYEPARWEERCGALRDLPERSERCARCFALRLERTCAEAKANGFSSVSSVLGFSRWKDFDTVTRIGCACAEKYGLDYWTLNWRKAGRQQRNAELIRQLNIYEQNYCGCTLPQSQKGV